MRIHASNHRAKRNGESKKTGPVLITGGAGFIGTNVAHRFLSWDQPVLLFDNLSRPGVEKNLEWLKKTHGSLVEIEEADVRDAVVDPSLHPRRTLLRRIAVPRLHPRRRHLGVVEGSDHVAVAGEVGRKERRNPAVAAAVVRVHEPRQRPARPGAVRVVRVRWAPHLAWERLAPALIAGLERPRQNPVRSGHERVVHLADTTATVVR